MFAVCGVLTGELPYSDVFNYKVLGDSRGIHLFLKSASRTANKYSKIFVQQGYMETEADLISPISERVQAWVTEEDLNQYLKDIFIEDNKTKIMNSDVENLDELLSHLNDVQIQAVVDSQEFEHLKAEAERLEEELSIANMSIEGLQGVIATANQDLDDLRKQYAVLEGEKNELATMYNDSVATAGEQQRENEVNINEFEKLSEEYNTLVGIRDELEGKCKVLESECNSLRRDLNNQKEIAERLQEQLTIVNGTVASYDNLKIDYQEAIKNIEAKTKECEALRGNVEELKTRCDDLFKRNEELSAKTGDIEIMGQLREQLNQANASNRQLTELLSISNVTKEQLQTKVSQLQESNDKLKADLETAKMNYGGNVETGSSGGVSIVKYNELQLQVNQLREKEILKENEYRTKITKLNSELQEVIGQKANLENRIASTRGNVTQSILSKYDMFATNATSVITEKMTTAELNALRGVNLNNFSVCLFAGGDSTTQFLTDFTGKSNTLSKKVLIVDLTNDFGIASLIVDKNVRKRLSTINMLELENLRVENLASLGSNCMGFVANKYNDIALLSINWGMYLARIAEIANDAPVCILLGGASSFAMKSTFIKLASVCRGYMFSDGRTMVLLNTVTEVRQLYNVVKFLLVVTKMSQSANKIVESMTSMTQVKVLPGAIDFEELGVM